MMMPFHCVNCAPPTARARTGDVLTAIIPRRHKLRLCFFCLHCPFAFASNCRVAVSGSSSTTKVAVTVTALAAEAAAVVAAAAISAVAVVSDAAIAAAIAAWEADPTQ